MDDENDDGATEFEVARWAGAHYATGIGGERQPRCGLAKSACCLPEMVSSEEAPMFGR
jgi:hypothetical protein